MSLLVLFVLFPAVFSYNFTEDYDYVLRLGACVDNCYFNQSEINIQTIELFPTNCSNVCAILTFNSNSNGIPIDKLKTTFKNVTILTGGLRIDNTSFTNISFLDSIKYITVRFALMSISDNLRLTNVDMLYKLKYTYLTFPLHIVNNPKLDVGSLCIQKGYIGFPDIYVYKNLKDCGCIGTVFDNNNVKNYKNCTSMFGIIDIVNSTDVSKFSAFSNIKNITGNITIHNSNFRNLSFLKSLERITGYNEGTNFVISNNTNMARLSLDSLTSFKSDDWFTMTIENVHPDFCLTMEEMQRFTKFNIKFTKIEAKYCNITTRSDGAKVCIFKSMSTLEAGCEHIMGRVVVASGDEQYTEKLTNVKNIYGSLSIQNTTLTDLSFLFNLTNVALLNDTAPAIQLLNSLNLSDILMPYLAFPFSPGPDRFVIQNIAPDVFLDSFSCNNYQWTVKSTIVYNGGDCYLMNGADSVWTPGEVAAGVGASTGTDKVSNESNYFMVFIILSVIFII